MRRTYENGEVEYAIHEAHYTTPGRASGPCSITVDPIAPSSEDIDGLRWVLQKMLQSLDKPVLDYETREELP